MYHVHVTLSLSMLLCRNHQHHKDSPLWSTILVQVLNLLQWGLEHELIHATKRGFSKAVVVG